MKGFNSDEFCIDDVLSNLKKFKKKDKGKKKKESHDEKVAREVGEQLKKNKRKAADDLEREAHEDLMQYQREKAIEDGAMYVNIPL